MGTVSKGRPKPMQFTLRQLLWWVFVASVFLAAWKTTENPIFAAVLATGFPVTAKLGKLDNIEWRKRHRNSMREDLWVMLAVSYWILLAGFLSVLLLPVVH